MSAGSQGSLARHRWSPETLQAQQGEEGGPSLPVPLPVPLPGAAVSSGRWGGSHIQAVNMRALTRPALTASASRRHPSPVTVYNFVLLVTQKQGKQNKAIW